MTWRPGDLVVVRNNSLVTRWDSEETGWTERPRVGLVLCLSYRMRETSDGEIHQTWLVLFSNDMRLYLVTEDQLMTLDQYGDPSRLFGTAHCGLQE